jgi:hypothetical protein
MYQGWTIIYCNTIVEEFTIIIYVLCTADCSSVQQDEEEAGAKGVGMWQQPANSQQPTSHQ